jgi:serine/threonine protein kinase
MFRQITSVMHHSHQKGIVHSSLKEMVCLAAWKIQISDFGMTKRVMNRQNQGIFCSTLLYYSLALFVEDHNGFLKISGDPESFLSAMGLTNLLQAKRWGCR